MNMLDQRSLSLRAAPGKNDHPATSVRSRKQRRPGLRKRVLFYTGGYLIVAIILVLYALPLLSLVNASLKTPSGFILDPTGLTKTFEWKNYVDAWNIGAFGTTIFNSLLYTVISSVLSTVFSVLLAFPIARGYVKGSRFWYILFVVALFLPSALIPQFQLMVNIGLYDTQIGYILLQTATLGVGPFLVIGYLRSIPRDLDEAAVLDGCGYFRYVLTVATPLMQPVLVTTFLLHAIGVWNDIIGPTIYLSNAQYTPVTLGLFAFYGQYGNEWAKLSAATLIVALPLILLYVLLQRYFIEGAVGGALKS